MKLRSLFDDRQFYRNLFAIAVPVMLQNLINAFVNMVDTVMVGRLGTVEIAAVGLGNQVVFLYTLILFGIVSGGSIFTAQFWGKRDLGGIRKNTGFCLLLNLLTALIFSAGAVFFPKGIIGIYSRDPLVIASGALYLKTLAPAFIPFAVSQVFVLTLRSTGEVKIPMVTTVIALLVNMVLNYLLIFGAGPVPPMGVAGAAAATVAARVVELLILLFLTYRGRYAPAGSLRELLAFNGSFVRHFFRICIPVILNEFVWSLGITVQNIIFARTHTGAIAAFNITNTVSQLTWVLFIGLGNGVAVLIGNRIGEGKEAAARDYAARIVRFAPLLAMGTALILIPLSLLLPLIFNVGGDVLKSTGQMFIILALSYPFRAFNMSMVVGICRAGGDTVFCAVYDVIFMWAVALPLAAAASFLLHAPVRVIYLCVTLEEPFKVILGLWRYRSGKWLHNVIGGL
ncbi:MAG: MATE family efflux transporter [Treponema sp.]|jgi:putative MATE family efflux protein|nr:MATE family efflux transporter [Treponema sp.]